MLLTYQNLLTERLNYINGKARGFEWKPVKLPYYVIPDTQHGVGEAIQRILALALTLELPVGEWIGEVTKQDNIEPIAMELLRSNIADEMVHYRAFSYIAEDYLTNESYMVEANHILNEWNSQGYHPLEKSYYAEVGVFLVSLAVMRIFGGETLNNVAANVSRDENRHVATNAGVLADMGYDVSTYNKVEKTVETTLDWMLGDLRVPGLDKSFFMEQSHLLIRNRYAPELDELTGGCFDVSPFENPNYIMY